MSCCLSQFEEDIDSPSVAGLEINPMTYWL